MAASETLNALLRCNGWFCTLQMY